MDTVPRILVDDSASVSIGGNVEIRKDVEIRAHGSSRITVEDGVRIDRGVRILAANDSEVVVGKDSRIGLYSVLNGGDSIEIGSKVLISGFVFLQTSMHAFSDADTPIQDQGYVHGRIRIGQGAWLAAHVVVMPGISVGREAIVGSNAVVTRDVGEGHVAAGVPAEKIKVRNGMN
ncbi:MAG TPA: hypothetical protein VKA19_14995 [Alphaproteobacteria bacterium]|nr:hypothetical protein [Alphaproteobacteria bacterium]